MKYVSCIHCRDLVGALNECEEVLCDNCIELDQFRHKDHLDELKHLRYKAIRYELVLEAIKEIAVYSNNASINRLVEEAFDSGSFFEKTQKYKKSEVTI